MRRAAVFAIVYFSTLTIQSAFAAEAVMCPPLLRSYVSLPPVQFSEVETDLSKELESFFQQDPRGRALFRAAFYGPDRSRLNKAVEVATLNIPAHRRASVIQNILSALLRDDFSTYRDVEDRILQASLAWNHGSELFEVPEYSYNNLLTILRAVSSMGDHVLVFRDGRGEFALHRPRGESVDRFYRLDVFEDKARPIDPGILDTAFRWKERSISRSSQGWMRRFFRGSVGEDDIVRKVEDQLSPSMKLTWRYVMNALSDESYAMVRFLIERGVRDFKDDLHPLDVGLVPKTIRRFTEAMWARAKEMGYPVLFNQSVYAVPELDAMLAAYGIRHMIMESGGIGHRQFQYKGRNYQFVKERTGEDQLVFSRLTEVEFDQYLREQQDRMRLARHQYEKLPPLHSNVDLRNIPARPTRIPADRVAALSVALNPGFASLEGFKQPREDLLGLIDQDAEVVRRRGYTHKELAEWLVKIIELSEWRDSIVHLNNRTFEVLVHNSKGSQSSPFGDPFSWSHEFYLVDLRSGRRIRFTEGHPYMIGYYGFFEGDVPYRLPPEELIDMIEGP